MSSIKLQPDKTLLSPDFDGYKLSSCSGIVTSYNKLLSDGLCLKKGDERSTSYLQTRLDALHNCLIADLPDASSDSDGCSVYCFNSRGHLLAFDWSAETHLTAGRVVWQVDLSQDTASAPVLLHHLPKLSLEGSVPQPSCNEGDNTPEMCGTLQPTVKFASNSTAIVADGRCRVYVLHTDDRRPQAHHTWLTVYSASVGACKVVDARVVAQGPGASHELHALLVAVVPPAALPVAPPSSLSSAPSLHLVTWLTLSTENGKEYSVARERLYCGSAALEYCHFDKDCSAVVMLTHQLYSLIHDSSKSLQPPQQVSELPSTEANQPKPKFMFMQTDDDLTIQFLASNCTSSDAVRIVVSSSELCVSRRGDQVAEPLLKGRFLHSVVPETATWTVEEGRVEVSVSKAETEAKWLRLFQEETLVSEELLHGEDSADRLAHLTSDTWGGGNDAEDKPAYNPGQLESCDDADTDLLLQVLQGDTDTSSPECGPRALLGNTQYLATIPSGNGSPPLFCLRHDVDGLVWRTNGQLSGATEHFSHTATFNAFGYVKASKTMAKYTSAPADCSFICVSDVRSHVFVFCQPQPLGGELKNRRTGRVTGEVARQLLLSLPSHSEVHGLVALPDLVFVCTDHQIFAYALALRVT